MNAPRMAPIKPRCHVPSCTRPPSFRVWLLADGSDQRDTCGNHLTGVVRTVHGGRQQSYYVKVRVIR